MLDRTLGNGQVGSEGLGTYAMTTVTANVPLAIKQ